jgi:hypothetical protein
MYSDYSVFLQEISNKDLRFVNFKSNMNYQIILEHVSYDQGREYLGLIKNEFPFISEDKILQYIRMNDLYGNPTKYSYTIQSMNVECSPTSLRYVYHALLILSHYKKFKNTKIVEIGCGYGGLFLAVQYFSNLLNIHIDQYYFIDLPEVGQLIQKYLDLHKQNITIDYSIHKSNEFGLDIMDNDLFLISNYCFTEIDSEYRNNYVKHLLPKVNNGFIIWQTVFGLPITETKLLQKEMITVEEERPQTANLHNKNYHVYF